MKLFDVLSKHAPGKVLSAMLIGGITGLMYSMLIPLVLVSVEEPVNRLLQAEFIEPYKFLGFEVSKHKFALAFVLTCALVVIFRTISQVTLARVAIDSVANLRISIYERISKLPIANLEKIGTARLNAVLTRDVPTIVSGSTGIPDVLISMMTILGLLGFLVYLNIDIFFFILAGILFGIITFQIPLHIGSSFYGKSRHYIDFLYEAIRGLMGGAKELKLSAEKRKDFFKSSLIHNEDQIRKYDKKGFTIIQATNNYGDMVSLLVIGTVAFVLVNYKPITTSEMIGIIMAMLYITGPISNILNALPRISLANVALARVNQLMEEMPVENYHPPEKLQQHWKTIKYKNLVYNYPGENGGTHNNFSVGPVNFDINKGEITFIIGGNGSGKSTLAKMMSLHYLPSEGSIIFDNEKVTDLNRNTYRECISAIYSDYHLFEKILGTNSKNVDREVQQYMKDLELDDKVSVENGKFSTLSLSDGQKRRLALIAAFVEGRDLYVFDEWAADQDPVFKDIFYNQTLALLRDQGKAVVVISHDDRYFNVADRVITMESGKIVKMLTKPCYAPQVKEEIA